MPATARAPRLSRAASQAATRAQLIDTARQLLLREGYRATSIDAVAEAAGFSKGAVYSNFANKDELCLAVLDALLAERAAELGVVAARRGGLRAKLAAFETWAEHVLAEPGWAALLLDLIGQARTDDTLRAALATRAAAMRTAIALVLRATAASSNVALTVPAEELAVTVLGVGLGLALQRSLDDTVSARALTDSVRAAAGLPHRRR